MSYPHRMKGNISNYNYTLFGRIKDWIELPNSLASVRMAWFKKKQSFQQSSWNSSLPPLAKNSGSPASPFGVLLRWWRDLWGRKELNYKPIAWCCLMNYHSPPPPSLPKSLTSKLSWDPPPFFTKENTTEILFFVKMRKNKWWGALKEQLFLPSSSRLPTGVSLAWKLCFRKTHALVALDILYPALIGSNPRRVSTGTSVSSLPSSKQTAVIRVSFNHRQGSSEWWGGSFLCPPHHRSVREQPRRGRRVLDSVTFGISDVWHQLANEVFYCQNNTKKGCPFFVWPSLKNL